MLIGEGLAKDSRPCLTRQNVNSVTLASKLWMSIKTQQQAISMASREFRTLFFSTGAAISFIAAGHSATKSPSFRQSIDFTRNQESRKKFNNKEIAKKHFRDLFFDRTKTFLLFSCKKHSHTRAEADCQ